MKGNLDLDHIPMNRFTLTVNGPNGIENFRFTAITGIEEELDTVEHPDRSVAPGGRTKPVELVATLPLHHNTEQDQMEDWFKDSQADPNTQPGFLREATLLMVSLSGGTEVAFTYINMFPSKRSLSDFDADNDGEMAMVEWTLKATRSFKK